MTPRAILVILLLVFTALWMDASRQIRELQSEARESVALADEALDVAQEFQALADRWRDAYLATFETPAPALDLYRIDPPVDPLPHTTPEGPIVVLR